MNRICLVLLVCAVAACGLISPALLKAEDAAVQTEGAGYQVPVNDDGIEAVTLELKSGSKVVVYILRKTADTYFVQNLNDSMEVSVPRANVVNVRKPTAREIEKFQKRLGITPKQ
jgi:hypothetical protein